MIWRIDPPDIFHLTFTIEKNVPIKPTDPFQITAANIFHY